MQNFKNFFEENEQLLEDKPKLKWLFENVAKHIKPFYDFDYELQEHCERLSNMKGWIILFEEVLITDIDGTYFCIDFDYLPKGGISVKSFIVRGGKDK